MESEKNYREAAEEITAIINKGFVLSSSELHFIESSFSVSTVDELRQLILFDDSDLDVICELVVSPDKTIQKSLELFLNDACFTKNDEKNIIGMFYKKYLETKIIFPESKESLAVPLHSYLVKRFIAKLRVSKNPDKHLYKAAESLSNDLRLTTLVRIRNSSMEFSNRMLEFLVEFLYQKIINKEDFSTLFDFVVSSFEEDSCSQGIMKMFIDKKHSYEKTLTTIKEVKKQLETSAMETMMMQGTRVPPVSESAVETKINMVETILAIFFGYTDISNDTPSEIDHGRIAGKKEIKKIFRVLS